MSCCGERTTKINDFNNVKKEKSNNEIIKELKKTKIGIKDILFQYAYDKSKAYLIKNTKLECFVTNKNMFKIENTTKYYNTIHTSNYVGFSWILLMKTTGDKYQITPTYHIENIHLNLLKYFYAKEINENILQNINSLFLKDKLVVNISNFHNIIRILFRKCHNYSIDPKYTIDTIKNNINEESINNCLLNNKQKRLKSIFSFRNSKYEKFYNFLYEDSREAEHEYMILTLYKAFADDHDFIKIFTRKICDFDNINYELCSVLIEEDRLYIIFVSRVNILN